MAKKSQFNSVQRHGLIAVLIFAFFGVLLLALTLAGSDNVALDSDEFQDVATFKKPDQAAFGGSYVQFDATDEPPAEDVVVSPLTSGGELFESPIFATDSVSIPTGSRLLLWMTVVMSGNEASPIPSLSAPGLDIELVKQVTKPGNEIGSRRLYLYSAVAPSSAVNGPISIDLGGSYIKSKWSWAAVAVSGSTLVQVTDNVEGALAQTHSADLNSDLMNGNAFIAGFGIGNKDTITPDGFAAGSLQGKSTIGVTFLEWTYDPVSSLTASWSDAAHALAIAVEVGP